MPGGKEPRHRELLHAGDETGGRQVPFGDQKRHAVAHADAQEPREVAPQHHGEGPGLEALQAFPATCAAASLTRGSVAGSTPLIKGAADASPGRKGSLPLHEGRRRDHGGRASSFFANACQSSSGPSDEVTSMCATTESMRSRTSFWKPFMTESTMMSAATPSAIDATDIAEMKEREAVSAASPTARTRVGEADPKFMGKRNREPLDGVKGKVFGCRPF